MYLVYKSRKSNFTLVVESAISAGAIGAIIDYGISKNTTPVEKDLPGFEKTKKKTSSKKKKSKKSSKNKMFKYSRVNRAKLKNAAKAAADKLTEAAEDADTEKFEYNIDMVAVEDLQDLLSDLIEQYKTIYINIPTTLNERNSILAGVDGLNVLFDKNVIRSRMRKLKKFKEYIYKKYDEDYLLSRSEIVEFMQSIQEDVEALADMLAVLNVASTEAHKQTLDIIQRTSFTIKTEPAPVPSAII